MSDFLQTVELTKSYKKRVVVDKVSLYVEPGKVIGLLGANGAGKSTTFRMVAGLVKPDSGRVLFQGKDISHLPMYKRARIGIGYLPQESTIFRRLTVRDNIMIILQHLKLNHSERKKKLEALLKEMNLNHLETTMAEELSGGERRRLEVTRVLSTSPQFMMWDEPFAAVDPKIVEYLQEIIIDLRDRGIGILITDHKAPETLGISDYGYIINNGKILKEDVPSVLANDREVREVYLGDSAAVDALSQQDITGIIADAKILYREKSYQKMITSLTNVITKNDSEEIRILRGKAFTETGEYPSAIFDLKKAIEYNSKSEEAKKCLEKAKKYLQST